MPHQRWEAVQTDRAPAAVGPYSQGVIAGGFLFTSGQIPLTPEGEMVQGDIRAQARQCLENLRAVLEAGGAGMKDLVKVTVFVTDIAHFQAINEVYASYFEEWETPPARSFVQVAALPKGAQIEVEGVAHLADRQRGRE